MNTLQNFFRSAVHLFYPHNCIGCGSDIIRKDELLCMDCIDELPFTDFEKFSGNPVEKTFHGRIDLSAAACGFYFNKGGVIQHLIHELKYKGKRDAGVYLAKMMAEKMLASNRFSDIDYLIPLPLFAEREFKRGYNQAEVICNGISGCMEIPVLARNVLRIKATETQTKKHRTERWDNVSESFHIADPGILQNRHILLVDDVITTGATLEACAQAIKKCGEIRISIAALAIAGK